jgi:hypothetical protein
MSENSTEETVLSERRIPFDEDGIFRRCPERDPA